MDVTFWRPTEADRKKESVSVVKIGHPDIPFLSISHGELTFRQNFSSNSFTLLSSTQFWQMAATASHLLAREGNHTSNCEWWNASGTSKFLNLSKKLSVSLASMANAKEMSRWGNSEHSESRLQCSRLTDAPDPTEQPDVGCVSQTVIKGIPALICHHSKSTFKNQGLIKVIYPSVLPYALLTNVKLCLFQKTLTPKIIQSVWHLPYTMQNKSVLWKYGISQNMPRGSLEVILNDLRNCP